MFNTQLTAETLPSQWRQPQAKSLNDSDDIRRLLERSMGYRQFRVELPGTVTWDADHGPASAAGSYGETTLEEAVMAFLPEDRTRVVDAISEAIAQKNGFRITARIPSSAGAARVIELIGDVVVENEVVTGIFGLTRDVSHAVEQEAMAISRARLIRRMVEEMPVPVVVLDRSLRVAACSADWLQVYGLEDRDAAVGQPLGKVIDARGPLTDGIVEALNGRTARVSLDFYTAEDNRRVRRTCTTMPWECGTDDRSGVLIIYGTGEPAFASLDISDRVQGRSIGSLLQMLETLPMAQAS